MKKKIPVILALSVTSQCAPLMTQVNGEDLNSEQARIDNDIVQAAKALKDDQKENEHDLVNLLTSEKEYVRTEADLLMNEQGPSAVSVSLSKREAVFVLETDGNEAFVSDEHGDTGWISMELLCDNKAEIFDDVNQTMYASQDDVNVYASPDEASAVIGVLAQNDAVNETGTSPDAFARVEINGRNGYVLQEKLIDHKLTFSRQLSSIQSQPTAYSWSGAILNPSNGSVIGPSGKETYYNLDMSGVISTMRSLGFDSADYPYWVRSDGAKMLGPYIMVAADLGTHPRGTTMEISLGTALVCDTGGFVSNGSGTQVDVAVSW